MLTPAEQRYEVAQLMAEARVKGIPQRLTYLLVCAWFDKHHIRFPKSLVEWFAAVPRDEWSQSRRAKNQIH